MSVTSAEIGMNFQKYLELSKTEDIYITEDGKVVAMLSDKRNNPGIQALEEAHRFAEEHGIADMTLDEINAEIDAVRRGK